MSGARVLRERLERGELIWAPGAPSVFMAKLIEKAGFEALAVQTFQSSVTEGIPDTGVWTPREEVDLIHKISRAVDIPIISDFEQGHGDIYDTIFWMNEFERAGAAALHIDDYGLLYRCPVMPPYIPELRPAEEMAAQIRAMVDERLDKDTIIIARSGAYQSSAYTDVVEAREEAITRCKLYKEAGADVILATARTLDELKIFRTAIEGPMHYQIGVRGRAQLREGEEVVFDRSLTALTVDELHDLGIQIITDPMSLVGVATKAILEAAQEELAARTPQVLEEKAFGLGEHLELMDVPRLVRLRNKYHGEHWSIPGQ